MASPVSGRSVLATRAWRLCRAGSRKGVEDLQLFGDLLAHDPGGAQVLADLSQCRRLATGHRGNDGAHPLTKDAVGQPDHGDLGDGGVSGKELLHLLSRNVLAVPDDDVLEPSGDLQVAGRMDAAEVSGSEPPVNVECFRVHGRVGVAVAERRAPDQHFADFAGRHLGSVRCGDPHLDPGGDPAVRAGQDLGAVPRVADGDHRCLGHAVVVRDGHPHLCPDGVEDFRRARRATAFE